MNLHWPKKKPERQEKAPVVIMKRSIPLPDPPAITPPPPRDDISYLPYYHPNITNQEEVTKLMSQYTLQEGYFILRNSFSEVGSYTITVNHRSGLKHMKIEMKNEMFTLKDKCFQTIDELIQFYSYHEIPNKENISNILLRFPVRRFQNQLSLSDFGHYIDVSKKEEQHEDTANGEDRGRKCEYDIRMEQVILPLGWSMHQSKHPNGLVFYMSPTKERKWQLPDEVFSQLTVKEKMFIQNINSNNNCCRNQPETTSSAEQRSQQPMMTTEDDSHLWVECSDYNSSIDDK